MNVDELKQFWKEDMNRLERRVEINEQKIRTLEVNKAKTGFDQLLKISLMGKNMALVYAAISLAMIYAVKESIPYILLLVFATAAMVFSYFQHSVLKPLDYGRLSLIGLQKEIAKFRIHTARTAFYDMSIVAIWLISSGLAYMKWTKGFDIFQTPEKLSHSFTTFGIILIVMILLTKVIYGSYDTKLKGYENDLEALKKYSSEE